MDGVLVNSEVYHTEACEELLREAAGKPVDTRAFHIPGIDTDELYRIGLEKAGCTGDPKLLSRLHFERTLELVKKHAPAMWRPPPRAPSWRRYWTCTESGAFLSAS